jgi:quercetin dioxygenase-like cupin family protein
MAKDGSTYVFKIEDLPLVPLGELMGASKGVAARFMIGEKAMISFIQQPPGAQFPVHKHDAEQIFIILEGSEEHIVGGKEVHMIAGDVCVHPAGVEHGGKTATGYKAIDVFVPPRQDYIDLMKKNGINPDEFTVTK